ncbi:MAG: S8 family peptidase [Victivallales bacterium]
MATQTNFEHLPLATQKIGVFKLPQIPIPGAQATASNKQNRQQHRDSLFTQAQRLSRFWHERQNERQEHNLITIPGGVPFLLEIEPTSDVEFLRGLGFEIVCDLDEGFIIVSSSQTDLNDFLQKVDGFILNNRGTGNIAKVYALHEDNDRLKRILSNDLYNQWNTLDNNTVYTVEVSVSCAGIMTPPHLPQRANGETEDAYNARIANKKMQYADEIERIVMERERQLCDIVSKYEGQFLTSLISEGDTFSVTLQICGRGLRDIVLNYAYIFEVSFKSEILTENADTDIQESHYDIQLDAPDTGSPIVCIIDSGIQENHRYIANAILEDDSICLIPDQTSVNDEVPNGGHGTRVAGAVLFPKEIPTTAGGAYLLPCFIRNVKVLDANNGLLDTISREGVLEFVVKKFAIETDNKTKIFNHSIGENRPFYELKHMSSWAAKIDDLSYEYDVLFIQAAGNMRPDIIRTHIQAGYNYPDYFGHQLSQIANPAQSLQALTVGSISNTSFETDDVRAMGVKGDPSSFTRIGPGIWDSIKPEVVEFGGTHAINKNDPYVVLTTPPEVCPNLIRTSPEGLAFAKDNIGTSFSTPKVASIAAGIQKILPNSPALLYRALIAQSARWLNDDNNLSQEACQFLLRTEGYGLPDLEKATQNTNYRVTLATMNLLEIGEKEAHIFSINIPQELRDLGEDYNMRIEITLSYASKPKRTRRSLRGYLSTWLDWTCSKRNESQHDFENRIFEASRDGQDEGQFPWQIHERPQYGYIRDFSRSKQTLQKDWCLIKSSHLSDTFCIAVKGHKGWGSAFKAKYVLTVSFEAIDQDIEIYEPIRLCNQVEIETETPELRVEI